MIGVKSRETLCFTTIIITCIFNEWTKSDFQEKISIRPVKICKCLTCSSLFFPLLLTAPLGEMVTAAVCSATAALIVPWCCFQLRDRN